MDDVSKKTIGEEIGKYNKGKGEGGKSEDILPVNTSPTNPKEKIKSKAPQTESRLSNLLEKIRSKSCIRGSAESSVKKMKKLQVKYERFDLISKTGGLRFIDLYTKDTILFKDIHTKVEKLFVGTKNYNYFVKALHKCVTSINDTTRQQLNENKCLWDYLKKRKLVKIT